MSIDISSEYHKLKNSCSLFYSDIWNGNSVNVVYISMENNFFHFVNCCWLNVMILEVTQLKCQTYIIIVFAAHLICHVYETKTDSVAVDLKPISNI